MKRAKKIYSGRLDVSKAAEFFDRLHRLKDALEELQVQYAEDIAEVVTELSDAQSIDPALIRMAFTQERQKRKREARIAKMDSGKAYQLDLLADAAAGSDAHPVNHVDAKLVERVAQAVQTKAGQDALRTAVDIMIDTETGEIIEEIPAGSPASDSGLSDKTVLALAKAPTLDKSDLGPVETTVEPNTASNPGAVASVSGPSRPEMEIPDFLLRKQPDPAHA